MKLKEWDDLTEDHLFAVGDLDATPLAPIASRTIYALIARGALACVRIGARRFVSKRAIKAFINEHEASASPVR